MGRAPCCEKVGLKRGRWTREEDDILARYIREHGEGAWRSLPKNAGLLRCGKSCRLRWINYLRADLKRGNISREEEEMIIRLHATLGNRWSLIAGHFPGRTDNEIKNHWNSHLCKRERDLRDGTVVDVDLTKLPDGGKRRGGRARSVKASLKKGKGKDKRSRKAKSKAAENHKEEDGDISASPPPQGEEQAHACVSGVTSDGLDEGALGLCEEMVSGLKGQPSPNPDVTPDVSNIEPPMAADHGELGSNKAMELDRDDGRCNESESVPGVPAEPAGQAGLGGTKAVEMGGPGCCNEADSGPSEAMGSDKDMEWDLVGLDENLARDDLWTSLVWDYDEVVPPAGAQEEEAVLSDLFFFDDM